ncbi:unnamed protein product [Zymoseptoria tritici ST99CH_1A5]|uniref:non-specific serine/threonine protein kinase n=1 Tax=Zymoseptoria tritici ST99CH_1A5 TaxID=1276529 RepID=A0A1Y6L841_ZYMTR|nr:unnamed protein product [Zymoseptoria tritici ST99CH_1A5]
MTAPFLRRIWKPLLRRAWKPLTFPRESIASLPIDSKVEEETIPGYVATRYYPVRIGELFQDRYQVVGKLGYGITSTVWLARDTDECQHAALKVHTHDEAMGDALNTELDVYKRVENSSKHHPGRCAVRTLLDSFHVDGPSGQHMCLVHPPLWESLLNIKHRNDVGRLPAEVLAFVLKRLFHALMLLHEECHVVHTDIKEANILLGADSSVLAEFEAEELKKPSPRKEVDGSIIYQTRRLGMPRDFGAPVLCDFGSAVPLDDGREHLDDIQPDIYRAPEVILDIPWTYSVDIWNVGCMIWDVFEGEHLFTGRDPEIGTYRSRAHLAEIIALLGTPPPELLARANSSSKFFSEQGELVAGLPLSGPRPLEQRETTIQDGGDVEDRECFLRFMRKMLQWEPEKRSTARELADDEWILKHT